MDQVALSIGIPTLAILVGILVNNRQLDALGKRIDRLDGRLDKLDARIDKMEGSLEALEFRLGGRIGSNARFDAAHEALLRVEGVIDARLKHLEDSESKRR